MANWPMSLENPETGNAGPALPASAGKRLVAKDPQKPTAGSQPIPQTMTLELANGDLDKDWTGLELEDLFNIDNNDIVVDNNEDASPAAGLDQVWSVTGHGQSLFETNSEDSNMIAVNPFLVLGGLPTSHCPEEEDEKDLVKMVMDNTLEPDDPSFMAFVGVDSSLLPSHEESVADSLSSEGSASQAPVSPTHDVVEPYDAMTGLVVPALEPGSTALELLTVDPSALAEPSTSRQLTTQPKRRGRPRVQRSLPVEPLRRPRGRPPTAPAVAAGLSDHVYDGMSAGDVKEVKYRRMRDLNNAASKRCRVKRKMKHFELEEEERILREKNTSLKIRVSCLEQRVASLKEGFLAKVKQRSMM